MLSSHPALKTSCAAAQLRTRPLRVTETFEGSSLDAPAAGRDLRPLPGTALHMARTQMSQYLSEGGRATHGGVSS